MKINSENLYSITEISSNFSKLARHADENGYAGVIKNSFLYPLAFWQIERRRNYKRWRYRRNSSKTNKKDKRRIQYPIKIRPRLIFST